MADEQASASDNILATLNATLDEAKGAAKKAAKEEATGERTIGASFEERYRALQKIRVIGNHLSINADDGDEDRDAKIALIKKFLEDKTYEEVDSKGESVIKDGKPVVKTAKFSKPVEKNVYVVLTRLAFTGISKGLHSQYASVLKLHHHEHEDLPETFAEWVAGEHQKDDESPDTNEKTRANRMGIKGAYKRARVVFADKDKKAKQVHQQADDIKKAQAAFVKSATAIIDRDGVVSGIKGAAVALVYYDTEKDQLVIDEDNAIPLKDENGEYNSRVLAALKNWLPK